MPVEIRLLLAAMALAAADVAAAQAIGNPPGNTLAPADVAPPPPAAATPAPGMPRIKVVPASTMPVAAAGEKIICKVSIETGSFIARRKTCLTKAQWNYVNDENERVARQMVEDGTSKFNEHN